MSLFDPYWLTELHRATYVAILKSWVPHGQRAAYARRAGVTPVYLSLLCALDDPARMRAPNRRLPSAKAARRLAEALPAPPEVRRSLIEHIHLAHLQAHQGRQRVRHTLSQRQLGELMTELAHLHQRAGFGADANASRFAYRALCQAASDVLTRVSPRLHPIAYAQICLYLHDAQCVLDNAADALFHAKLAHLALTATDAIELGYTRQQVDDLQINAVRGQAVAHNNLGLIRQVLPDCDQAEATRAFQNNGQLWKPLVARDRLNAMARLPRTALRTARYLANAARAVCEDSGNRLALLMVREAWLRCLVSAGAWREAEQVFQDALDLLPHTPQAGPLHRALIYKSGAHLAWQQGNEAGWRNSLRPFLTLADQAGLRHQLRLARQTYGVAVQDLASQLGVNMDG